MALSKAEIYFNFEKAKKQATELENVANRISRLASSDLNRTMQTISVNWKGDNASAYLKKGNKLEQEILDTAKALRRTASDIRQIAKNMYDAEMRALEIAQRRTYNS